MPRPKIPIELARLKGCDKRNPKRYRGEVPTSDLPVSDAPEYFDDSERKAWDTLVTIVPVGVLSGADAVVLELSAVLLAEFRADRKAFQAAKLGHLRGMLGSMGLTPSDRRGLAVEPKDEKPAFRRVS